MTEHAAALSAKALIMLVSRLDTLEVAVEKLAPETVGVITSQNILKEVVLKCAELEEQGTTFEYSLVDSPMEIGDTFERFVYLLDRLREQGYEPNEIMLDATGGSTPMKLGAALGAMQRGIEMVHQRWPQRFEEGRWVPEEGAEVEVAPMRNPLEATGLLLEGQAVALFNRRDYSAAALVFQDVADKVSGVEREHYYKGLMLLALGYAAWDVADYDGALQELKAAREELGVGFTEAALSERAALLTEHARQNLQFLGKVRGKLSVEKVVDMVENARRRILDQARYDDGVARLYRAVEMWHQWRLLAGWSVDTKDVRWEKIPEGSLEEFLRESELAEPPGFLDLTRARALDRILSDDLAEDDKVLRDLLRQRNNSILAHGLDPIGEASAKRFLSYVDEMVDKPQVRAQAAHPRLEGL